MVASPHSASPLVMANVIVVGPATDISRTCEPHRTEGGSMSYDVTAAEVAARPTAVVAATTTWQEFPTLWRQLLDEVWQCLRASSIERGCRNVMLYRDDTPRVNVEAGGELLQPCTL